MPGAVGVCHPCSKKRFGKRRLISTGMEEKHRAPVSMTVIQEESRTAQTEDGRALEVGRRSTRHQSLMKGTKELSLSLT